jgi:hypothetical protein
MQQSSIPQNNHTTSHNPDMPPKCEAVPPPGSGRGPNGRFTKGNVGGPGNPFARQVAAMRQEFLKAVTSEDMAEIARAMIAKAKEGDVAAAKIVLQYTLGRPAEAVDPDRLDEGEWQQWQREVVHTSGAHAVFEGCSAETVCAVARAVVPLLQEKMIGEIAATFQGRQAVPAERESASEEREMPSGKREATRKKREIASQDAPKLRGIDKQTAAAGNESRVEPLRVEEGGQQVPGECREDVVAWVLRMLEGAVNKRPETARSAANDSPD